MVGMGRPNQQFELTSMPPLRYGMAAAQLRR